MMVMFTSHRAWLGLLLCTGLGCSGGIEAVGGTPGPAAPSGGPGAAPVGAIDPNTQPTTPTQTPANVAVAGSGAPGVTPTMPVVPVIPPAIDPMMPAAMQPATTAPGAITYNKHIRPIMAANCSMACHGPDPAVRAGPVALDTYMSVKTVGALVVNAVIEKRMPPWPPDVSCRQLRDTPPITEAERQLFKQWQDGGFLEGSAEEFVPPPPDAESMLGEPTRIVELKTAITPPAESDQYTCGLVNYNFPEDTYLQAIEVIPDQKAEVHHVQVHVVSGVCTTGDNMYSWRPGGKRLTFSKGDAALIPRGSTFALQMHYNTFGKTPMPDKTKVALWELPAGTKPERVVTRTGIFGFVQTMPPGAVVSTKSSQNVGGAGTEIIGVSPHAHMIAKHMNATLSRSGGKSECLTDIPDWSFEWQLDYIFKDPLPLQAGDTVNVVCDYDNGPNHQPTVDGVKRQQAITVGPGEGSADEMCLHYIWLRRPVN
jgi:hypothetical protein